MQVHENIEITSFYDHMETNEEMASSMLKKQFNHFKVKKVH